MSTNLTVSQTTGFVVGRPWSFSPSALLSSDDLAFLWRMLECHNCRLRQIYHALTAVELRRDDDALSCSLLRPRRHFHQLARLIKAVLKANEKQRKCASSTRRTSRHRQPFRPWICHGHGRDLFQYLFYADEDSYDPGNRLNATRSQWVGAVFPKGQSEFYGKGRSVFEEDEGKTKLCFSTHVECGLIPSADGRSCLSHVTKLLESLNMDPFMKTDSESIAIQEANRRWFEAYASYPEPKRKVSTKCVHFPNFSPVTSVHNLITYSCASRLQRADRTWEIDAMRRETPPPEHKAESRLCDKITEDGFTNVFSGEADVRVCLPPVERFPIFSNVPPTSEPSCPTVTVSASLSFPNTESKPGIDSSSGLLPDVISCKLTVSATFPKKRRRRKKHRNRATHLKPSVSPILSDLPCISLDWPSCTNTFYSEQMRSLDSILSHEMRSFPLTASCCYTTPSLAKSQKYF